ncbi:hypothetical protein SE336_16135 [Xanthomonas arboricola]|uniref:hypothetical protein n=1 Tax=Xanthomonas arboricola TaxID=56448 RepID=UPI0039F5ED8D
MNEQSGNSGQLQSGQQAHIEELTELRRLVPSVNQRAALDAAIAALAARQPAAAKEHFQDRLADIEGRARAEPEPPRDACACCYSNDCNGECMENL